MKVLRWHNRGDLRLEDIAEPSPRFGEVKIRVSFSGICGTDLHEYQYGPIFTSFEPHPITGKAAPVVLGHEFSGTVVEVGEGVSTIKVGDRVTAGSTVSCGKCYYCLRDQASLCPDVYVPGFHIDGSMAEYVVLPEKIIYRLPESISDEIGAVVEPLACSTHAVRRSKLQLGDTVAIVGAGPIGLCALLAAKAAGASEIYTLEICDERAGAALKMGATTVLNPKKINAPEEMKKLTNGRGAHVSIDCVGNPISGPLAVELTRNGGTVVIMGMSPLPSPDFNFSNVMFTEKNVIGSQGCTREFPNALGLLKSGRIDASTLITSKVQLKDAVEKGFKELINHPEKHIKILVQP